MGRYIQSTLMFRIPCTQEFVSDYTPYKLFVNILHHLLNWKLYFIKGGWYQKTTNTPFFDIVF